jgi:IstB-like ATP binding protein
MTSSIRRLPAHKSLEETAKPNPGAERPLILHLAQLAWITEHSNLCLFGPLETGKTHCEASEPCRLSSPPDVESRAYFLGGLSGSRTAAECASAVRERMPSLR